MFDKAVMPKVVTLDQHEVDDVTKVRIGLRLGMTPSEVDAMPYDDYTKIIAVLASDNDISQHNAEKKRLQRQSQTYQNGKGRNR